MIELLPSLILFAFTTSITPGPNNMMLMASGANFGVRRTIPHMLGVSLGFAFMAFVLGLGLAEIIERAPSIKLIMKILSVAFMSYIALQIASAKRKTAQTGARPLRFIEAAAFQWINPKAVAMAISALLIYTPNEELSGVIMVVAAFAFVNLFSISSWAIMGQMIARFLNTSFKFRAFNISMAVLLLLSMIPILKF